MATQTLIYLITITCFIAYIGQICASDSTARSTTDDDTSVGENRAFDTGRTFGAVKKFQTALLPIMYKLGVMSAIIMMTLFLAFKGVFIGTLILVMNLTFFAIKFGSYLKHDHQQATPTISYVAPPPQHDHIWQPPSAPAWGGGGIQQKDVHLHIHNSGQHHKGDYSNPYGGYGNLAGASSQWSDAPIVASEAPHYSYGHSRESYAHPHVQVQHHQGRSMGGNDLSILASHSNPVVVTDKIETIRVTAAPANKSRIEKDDAVIVKRESMTPPIVKPPPLIVPPISTYHFVKNTNASRRR